MTLVRASASEIPALTRRERDVLVELARPGVGGSAFSEPASVRQIAEALFVSEAAVKQHLLRLYDKFDIAVGGENRRLELANACVARGIVTRTDVVSALATSAARPPSVAVDLTGAVADGRRALSRRDWKPAYEALQRAHAASPLSAGDDLSALGEAALWSGHVQESIDAFQLAHAVYQQDGKPQRAAMSAISLWVGYVLRRKFSAAGGWLARARRHLDGQSESREHGHLAAHEALALLSGPDVEGALAKARIAAELGRRHGDRDCQALGLTLEACALLRGGKTDVAMGLFDEAMTSASAGDLGPFATGLTYCRTLCACVDVLDYARALEWTDVIEQGRLGIGGGGFAGDCRAHRASVLAAKGRWQEAEREARTAHNETESFDLGHVGLAAYEIGELRLCAGDHVAARQAFAQARELGGTAEPGASLLCLAEGNPDAALVSLGVAMTAAEGDPLRRAKLLPAHIEIALALHDLAAAKNSAEELGRIATSHSSRMLATAAAYASGLVALEEGAIESATQNFRHSVRSWTELDVQYLAACARFALGKALLRGGDEAAAGVEVTAARSTFVRLGAVPDQARADDWLAVNQPGLT